MTNTSEYGSYKGVNDSEYRPYTIEHRHHSFRRRMPTNPTLITMFSALCLVVTVARFLPINNNILISRVHPASAIWHADKELVKTSMMHTSKLLKKGKGKN